MGGLPKILRRSLLPGHWIRMSRRTDMSQPQEFRLRWQWVLHWSLHGMESLTPKFFGKLELNLHHYRTQRTTRPPAPRDAPTMIGEMSPTTLVRICGLVAGQMNLAIAQQTRLSLPLRPSSCSLQHPRNRRQPLRDLQQSFRSLRQPQPQSTFLVRS